MQAKCRYNILAAIWPWNLIIFEVVFAEKIFEIQNSQLLDRMPKSIVFLMKPELEGSQAKEEVASHKSHMLLPSSLYKRV